MTPMRILIRSELYLPTMGGVQTHVDMLARGLVRRGHHVRVLTTLQRADSPTNELVDGVPVTRTPGFGTGTWGLVGGIACAIPSFRRLAPQFDVWHSHVVFAAVPACLLRALGHRRAHVITVHTSRFLRMAAGRRWRPVIRRLLRSADEVLAMSRQLRDAAQAIAPDVPITPLVNAVDTDRFKPGMPMLRPHGSEPLVVCPRRLVHKNGVDVLLDAWPEVTRLTGATLVVCGIGEEQRALEQRAERLGCGDAIQFYGLVDHLLMPAILSSADLVVVPSRVEATSLAALEALACQRPVVASNVGGLPEVVDEAVGRLVPSESPAALAAAIVGLLRLPREEREAMGRLARQRVVERWSLGQFLDAHEAVYERAMLKAKRKGAGA